MDQVNAYSETAPAEPVPIAVVTGDTHGQRCAWARHPDLRGDSYFALTQIVDHCLARRLPLILLGDVFDVRCPDSHTVSVFVTQLERLRCVDLGVYFIQGQHEYSPESPWLHLVAGSWHVHKTSFFLPSAHHRPHVRFYGLDFTHAADLPAALEAIPPATQVLLAHQVWEEHMGKHAAPEGALGDVPHVPLVLTGDFHGHKVTEIRAADERKLRVASPGSTCLQAIDEDPDKYFFELYSDLSLRSISLQCRPVYHRRIRVAGELDGVVRELSEVTPDTGVLPQHIARPIVHVRYREDLPEVETRLRAALGDRGHLFLTLTRAQREEEEARQPVDGEGPHGLEWHLSRCRTEEPSIYESALRLWRANDLKTEIKAIIAEALQMSEDLESFGLWDATRVLGPVTREEGHGSVRL